MSHGDRITKMPPGFEVAGVSPNAPFAVIQDEKRKYYGLMFHPEVVHTPHGAALMRNFVRKIAARRRLDHARLQGRGDRENPQAGRQGPGDLRPVGRRRFRGRRGADPRGDRRPAHLRVRRSRPVAARRGRAGRRAVPRQLQHPARARRGREAVPRRARRRQRPGGEAQDHRPAVHRRVRGGSQEDRRRGISSRRARSIPT